MKKFLFLLLLAFAAIANAQNLEQAKTESQIRALSALAAQQNAARLARLPQSLVSGKILSVAVDGYLVNCEPATASHPAMPSIAAMVLPSQDRLIWIARDPATKAQLGEGTQIQLLGKEDGTHTYTTVLQRQNTVTNFCCVESLPPASAVTVLDRYAAKPSPPPVAQGSQFTPELTMKRSW